MSGREKGLEYEIWDLTGTHFPEEPYIIALMDSQKVHQAARAGQAGAGSLYLDLRFCRLFIILSYMSFSRNSELGT